MQNGGESGSIIATVNKGYRIGSVELQIAEGDPAQEYSWRTLDFFYECRMEQKGLEPIRKYHFRARFKAPGGSGPWSNANCVLGAMNESANRGIIRRDGQNYFNAR